MLEVAADAYPHYMFIIIYNHYSYYNSYYNYYHYHQAEDECWKEQQTLTLIRQTWATKLDEVGAIIII